MEMLAEGLIGIGVVMALARDGLDSRRDARLDRRAAPAAATPLPVSVLIPARNEAARIGACLDGLRRQRRQPREIIVVDDHSSDDTAAIVTGFLECMPNLRLVRADTLPHGWGGKNWGCWQAAAQASEEWLAFLDADVVPEPTWLESLVGCAEREGFAMLSALPQVRMHTTAEQLVLPAFFLLITSIYPFAEVNRPGSALAFAIGQCILIRRACYDAIGGHAAVRQSVLEDMQLAALAKQAGFRQGAAFAPDVLSVRMYDGWRSLLEGLSKNAEAGSRNAGARAAWVAMRQVGLAWAPLDLAVLGIWRLARGRRSGRRTLALGCALWLAASGVWGRVLQRRLGGSVWQGMTIPFGTLAYYLIAATAWLRWRLGGGLRWKGRAVAPALEQFPR